MSSNCVLKADWASFDAAKYACLHWHYSKTIPIGKLVKVGFWEDERFIGVIIFSRGTCKNIGAPFGLDQTEVCELTRVALTDHVHPTSKMLKIGMAMLKRLCPKLRLIVSYADSFQKHVGTIYQATNWVYVGPVVTPSYLKNGKRIADRGIGTICTELGISRKEYAERHGIEIVKMRKFKYVMPLDKKMRTAVAGLALPFPKKELLSSVETRASSN